ncbi:MAG: ABC transporter permease [bacterium]
MVFKYFAAFRKEWLILVRDIAGLILLFVMPMVMVVILALVQEFGWSSISKEPQIPVLFVDADHDSLGVQMKKGLSEEKVFKLVTEIDSVPVSQETARQLVLAGTFQIGIIIPEHATQRMRAKVQLLVNQTMLRLLYPAGDFLTDVSNTDSVKVIIYFDPAVRKYFRSAFISKVQAYNAKIESLTIFETFQDELRKSFPYFTMPVSDYQEALYFTEVYPSGKKEVILPTTTQHNVPSWAIFAMFFIVIPLTSSIIKEREEGSLIRLLTSPVSYFTIFMAKVGVYLIVCFVQFVLMVLAGIYILPLFNMPPLELGTHYLALIIMTIASSLSALGYGIMVGTIARTHQQAAAFGSVSVVVLAALGGLWVPTYLMPDFMRHVASYSPLNWAHAGFLDIWLRGDSLGDIVPYVLKLFIFFAVTVSIAAIYRKLKPAISV